MSSTDQDRILAAALNLTGDVQRAVEWYRSERLASFDHKTAETLVAEGRASDVLRLIDSLAAGPAG